MLLSKCAGWDSKNPNLSKRKKLNNLVRKTPLSTISLVVPFLL